MESSCTRIWGISSFLRPIEFSHLSKVNLTVHRIFMWTSKSKFIADNIYRVTIFESDKRIAYSKVIQLWQHDNSFRTFFISLLAECPFKAYFWETPPINLSNCDREFEFVLVNSTSLVRVKPDSNSFKQYFDSNRDIVTFSNLRQDALLVVPCPVANASAYSHIAAFIRHAPKHQKHLLWQTIGKKIAQQLNNNLLWVSTSGLGVYWLHIRLDSYPKYYCFKPYKQS